MREAIVGSDTPPVREQIRHGENGILVDFFNAQALAETVADALENRSKLQHLRAAARAQIVAQYDLASVCLPAQMGLVTRLAGMAG